MKKLVAIALSFVMILSFCSCAKKESKGSVYWLNFKPESDAALQEIAAKYTDKTGVEVKIITATAGEYESTLTAEMDKSEPPTLFNIGSREELKAWGSFCYDLRDTPVAKELISDVYSLYNSSGKLCSIGCCYECFGIIVNKALLAKAGHSLDEITNFESLKAVAEDIHGRAAELGFDAFTSSDLDSGSSWRFSGQLANVALYYEFNDDGGWARTPAFIKGTYLANFKNLWDLYVQNSAYDISTLADGGHDAQAEFGKGEAVFYQNDSREYSALHDIYGIEDEDLAMIPLYCGVNGEEKAGLNCGTENCWAVNGKAKEKDIQATLDFMYWMVTDAEATAILADAFGAIPYKQAPAPANVFLKQAKEYADKGNYVMTWAFNYTPDADGWRDGVVSAMNLYDADLSDESWEIVKISFVEGWAAHYRVANAGQ